ncbi:MAG TPA: nuclear transport factor 2 family protein [Marmoricola sp.]|nr:nuclear transport factor 2 family protein [Marmoricola sp.]
MTTEDEARTVVEAFNACITEHDLDRLGALMTDDHTFVDSGGRAWHGRDDCLSAWTGFFSAFPDYRNVLEVLTLRDDVVVVTGHSVCEEPALSGPAIWTVRIEAGHVAEWRVHDDTDAARSELGIA